MLGDIVKFLLQAVGDFFVFLLLLRFLMQWARASFAGPLGDFVLPLTNGVVKPLRRFIPGWLGLDWASLLPAWLIQSLVGLVVLALDPRLPGGLGIGALLPLALLGGLVDTVRMLVWVMIIALIGAAVISWINPYSPMAAPIAQLTRPVLRPLQRIIPLVGRIDLSPLVAILLLQVGLMLLESTRWPLMRLLAG